MIRIPFRVCRVRATFDVCLFICVFALSVLHKTIGTDQITWKECTLHATWDDRQVKWTCDCLLLIAQNQSSSHHSGIKKKSLQPFHSSSHTPTKNSTCIYYRYFSLPTCFPIIQITSHANTVSFPISNPHLDSSPASSHSWYLTSSSRYDPSWTESLSRQFSISQLNTHVPDLIFQLTASPIRSWSLLLPPTPLLYILTMGAATINLLVLHVVVVSY